MRRKHIISAICTTIVLLTASCAGEAGETLGDGRPVRLSAATTAITRAATNLQESAFEAGTEMNIHLTAHAPNAGAGNQTQVLGNPAVFVANAAEGNVNALQTKSGKPIYYPDGEGITLDVLAYYPTSVTKESSSFTIRHPQDEKADYQASDLMFASSYGVAETSDAIPLTFSHRMAKFIVKATTKDGLTIEKLTLKDIKTTVPLTTDANNGTLTLGTATNEADIEIRNNEAILIPPQQVNGTLLVVKTNQGDASFSINNKNLVEGREYTATVEIGLRNIGINAIINNWQSDIGTINVTTANQSDFTIEGIENKEYTGNAITQNLTVKYSSTSGGETTVTTLQEWNSPEPPPTGTGQAYYSVQYFANVNVGTATVIVQGLGDYSNYAAVKNFFITQATGSVSYDNIRTANHADGEGYVDVAYNYGRTHEGWMPDIVGDGTMSYRSGNPSVIEVEPTTGRFTIRGVGKATITATMAGDKNYTSASDELKINVVKRTVNDLTITFQATGTATYSTPYNGQEQEPALVVKDGERTLTRNTDYALSYSKNKNVNDGPAEILVTGMGQYSESKTITFNIVKATNGLEFDESDATLSVGSTMTRQATVPWGTVTYTSSNTNIATVSSAGIVTAISAGSVSTGTTITITATVGASADGNFDGGSKSYRVTVMDTEWTFNYENNRIYEWTAPVAGNYKLEVWGAKGGNVTPKGKRSGYSGGYGGYASGTLSLAAGAKLYVVVGGAGGDISGTTTGGAAGYNGGGSGGNGSSSGIAGGGGGGATHIASTSGLLRNVISTVYLIGGGGGGACNGRNGGGGGGQEGGQANYGNAREALAQSTQSAGYAQGYGQNGSNSGGGSFFFGGYGSGGGGAGWWGGRANTASNYYAGGCGGSGYIGRVSAGTWQQNTRNGNGYAKITYMK